jgi:uncharacterized oligopeptide transporter (OPT) family protein
VRQHFVWTKLTFADGVAAAETLVVLDGKGGESRGAARSMAIGSVLSGLLMTIREDARLLGQVWYRIPEMFPLGGLGAKMNVGLSWSLLSIGSGLLVGMRINISMVIGMTLAWVIAPPILVEQGLVAHLVRREVQLWILWPAVGCLVAGGLTTLALRWKVLVKSFRVSPRRRSASEFCALGVWGSIASAAALALVQRYSLGMPFGLTAIATSCRSLSCWSDRVLGDERGPISAPPT